jgi:hypothetical protein
VFAVYRDIQDGNIENYMKEDHFNNI